MNKFLLCIIVILPSFLFISCNKKDETTAQPHNVTILSSTATKYETDRWIGKWDGPEGTFLEITGGNGNYKITIQDLDGATHYDGVAHSNQIKFERNGKVETLQVSNGADTGMKWLVEKDDCLRTQPGEGWCRD